MNSIKLGTLLCEGVLLVLVAAVKFRLMFLSQFVLEFLTE